VRHRQRLVELKQRLIDLIFSAIDAFAALGIFVVLIAIVFAVWHLLQAWLYE
jgi:hypothetical protein